MKHLTNTKNLNYLAIIGALCLVGAFAYAGTTTISTDITNTVQYIQKLILTDNGGSDGTTGVVIDGVNGKIGIGTDSPVEKLEVYNGNIKAHNDTQDGYARMGVNTMGGYFQTIDGSGAMSSLIRGYEVSGVQAYFMEGNIGIGTSTPNYPLDITATGTVARFGEGAVTDDAAIDFNGTRAYVGYTTDYAVLQGGTSKGIKFFVNNGKFASGDSAMIIEDDGNVGIGTTTPLADFQVERNGERSSVAVKRTDGNFAEFFAASAAAGIYFDNTSYFSISPYAGLNGSATANGLNVDANGNIGIGTSTPSDLLTLYKFQSDHGIRIQGSSKNRYIKNKYSDNGNFSISDDTEEKLTIKSNGNIGIDTSNPAEKLDVAGNIKSDGFISTWYQGYTSNQTGQWFKVGEVELVADYDEWAGTFISKALRAQKGYVAEVEYTVFITMGVLSNTPDIKVIENRQSNENGADIEVAAVLTTNTASQKIIEIYAGNVGHQWVQNYAGLISQSTNSAVKFTKAGEVSGIASLPAGTVVNGVETMNIASDGNVGIGTASPDSELDVNGTVTVNGTRPITLHGSSPYGISVKGDSGTWAIGGYNFGGNAGTNLGGFGALGTADTLTRYYIGTYNTDEKISILANGNVGIGDTTPAQKLDVNGNIAVAGTTVHTSDARYKKDVTTLESALDKLLQLRGVSFLRRTEAYPEKNRDTSPQIGVIAQEVERIYPELVSTDEEGYKSVSYSNLTPILIEAIKEQQSMIDDQNARIEALEEKLELLLQQ